MRTILKTAIVAVGLAGCTAAEWDSINRPFNPSHGDSRLIDAKQRAIISINRPVLGADGTPVYDNKKKPVLNLAICAEPSPDALQATATALAAAGTSDAAKAAVNLSLSTSGSAASIGLRTQAIQLLRDAYYRLCEAYMNDGLDAIAYDVLQRRYQNQIIALLAVEQLTGTVTAQQAALNTTASGDAGAQAGLLSRQISEAEARKLELQEKKEANDKAVKELTDKNTSLQAKIDNASTPDAEKDLARAEKAGNESEIERLGKSNASITKEDGRLDQQITSLTTAFGEATQKTINSDAAATSSLSGGNATSRANIETQVANAVRAITLNAINQDYEAQVCFESLRYRNHVNQFKNDLNTVFKPVSDQTRILHEDGNSVHRIEGGVFLNYCKELFKQQTHQRQHQAHITKQRVIAMKTIVDAAANGQLKANEAAGLLLALEQSSSLTPGAAFLPRSFSVSGESGDVNLNVRDVAGALTPEQSKKLIEDAAGG